jgi:hypothetical protein
MRTTKSTLVYSSKTDSRWHILSSADTAPEEKLLKVIFVDKEANKRLRINRYGYNYKPSTEWVAFHRKFKMKKH